MRVILIGKSSGRLDCLAEAIARSKHTDLFILTNLDNPSLRNKGIVTVGPTDNPNFVESFCNTVRTPDGGRAIAVVSNEEVLAAGIVDRLNAIDISTVGPTQAAAQIETSKIFMRTLMCKRQELSAYCPSWAAYNLSNAAGIKPYVEAMNTLGCQVVIKPDGLTGGKGVRIQGEHLISMGDVMDYCTEILTSGDRLLLETRIEGQEFSRMAFTDGHTVVPMPAVQDHKRLGEGDHGVNTGGMGSYSDCDHSLPFLNADDLSKADYVNKQVIQAIGEDIGQPYRGVLYGNFIATADGVKLIEYNARFGDPEVMNVLPLLETDFADICYAIVTGTLKPEHIRFSRKATVVKYLLPIGYPISPVSGRLDLSAVDPDPGLRIYYGAVNDDRLTGSRAIAVVGIADSIDRAEVIAETAACQIRGPLYHRRDIGTLDLINQKIEQVRRLRSSDDSDSRCPAEPDSVE